MIIIPLNNDGARSIDVDLGNDLGVFTFRSYWNSTMETWNLDVTDDQDTDIILGLPMVVGINILKAHPDAEQRLGDLRVTSLNEQNNRTEQTMGETAFLIHYAPGEYDALFDVPDFLPVQVVDFEDVTQDNIC